MLRPENTYDERNLLLLLHHLPLHLFHRSLALPFQGLDNDGRSVRLLSICCAMSAYFTLISCTELRDPLILSLLLRSRFLQFRLLDMRRRQSKATAQPTYLFFLLGLCLLLQLFVEILSGLLEFCPGFRAQGNLSVHVVDEKEYRLNELFGDLCFTRRREAKGKDDMLLPILAYRKSRPCTALVGYLVEVILFRNQSKD